MRYTLLLLICLAGCVEEKPKPHPRDIPGGPPVTIRMATVQHDGHWWIYSYGESRPFAHHPDCPCHSRRPWREESEK